MHESTGRFVHPVFEYGLALRARVDAGERPSLEAEQTALEDLINREPEEAGGRPRGGAERRVADADPDAVPDSGDWIEDVRYALVCWLDETFINGPYGPWGESWNESKLEARLFGSNDRSWKFWDRARSSELLPRPDVLEVYYLCVALGFRGELGEHPGQLRMWVDRARRRLSVPAAAPNSPALEPPCDVAPLHGRDRFRTVVLAAGLLALVAIPWVTVLLTVR
jgi:type VI secretion system protein ImpK